MQPGRQKRKWKQSMKVEVLSCFTCVHAYMSMHVLPVLCQALKGAQSPVAVIQPPESRIYVPVVLFEKCRQRRVCVCCILCCEEL